MAVDPGTAADDAMVTIGIVTSRAEALVIASMLEAGGIDVWLGGEYHASVEVNSVALGGHVLRVPLLRYDDASALIREVGLPDAELVWRGGRVAIGRLMAAWLGLQMFFGIPAAVAGLLPWAGLLFAPLNLVLLPVDPRGRNEYFLAQSE